MQWLNTIIDEVVKRHPDGEILIESGATPSGTYHLGHLRELVTCDALLLELRRRGRQARHIQYVDDLDGLRKIPVNVPADYERYLGQSLCDIPAPDGSERSYADYFLQGLIDANNNLGVEIEYVRSHEKYRAGFFVPAIERALAHVPEARQTLQTVSGRQLEDNWSPIQVNEGGYLKKRPFVGIDTNAKTLRYLDKDGQEQETSYAHGDVKLDWRLDWPARWWLLKVNVEPFGRDHATKGGSYDTGVGIIRDIFQAEPPLPVPYDFVNMAGDTKKMSASRGTGLNAVEASTLMPPEVVRYFILRAAPSKRLYFDPVHGVMQTMDEFAALSAKPDRTEAEKQLLDICTRGQNQQTVSSVPFSHLVASYQASLKDVDKTLEVIKRTEHKAIAEQEADIIRRELQFIDTWLEKQAPDEVKFKLEEGLDGIANLNEKQKDFLQSLAAPIAALPADADGEAFHEAVYQVGQVQGLAVKDMFQALYMALIGKPSGPRAGWFMSILPRDWLIKRLKLET